MTLMPPGGPSERIQSAISAGSVVTCPFTAEAATLPVSRVGSLDKSRSSSLSASRPAVLSEHTASARRARVRCCMYSRRSCATSAMDGHSTTDTWSGWVSSSMIRNEMRVLPVPQGRMILPRACPRGLPPDSELAWSRRILTLAATASSCMADLDWCPLPLALASAEASICARRSAAAFTNLMSSCPPRRSIVSAFVAKATAPLVTNQRSAQLSLLASATNFDASPLRMSAPAPSASRRRFLHSIATIAPSERRRATKSMLSASSVVPAGRPGQSLQRQHSAMSQSATCGAAAATRCSNTMPSTSSSLAARASISASRPSRASTPSGGAALCAVVTVSSSPATGRNPLPPLRVAKPSHDANADLSVALHNRCPGPVEGATASGTQSHVHPSLSHCMCKSLQTASDDWHGAHGAAAGLHNATADSTRPMLTGAAIAPAEQPQASLVGLRRAVARWLHMPAMRARTAGVEQLG